MIKRNAHKFNAVKTVIDGHTFASKAEAKRYGELLMLQKAGEIRGLVLQPRFPLYVQTNVVKDDPILVGTYVADFAYEERVVRGVKPAVPLRRKQAELSVEWEDKIEEVKGFKTPLYRWKKKHVEAQYGVQITEITS